MDANREDRENLSLEEIIGKDKLDKYNTSINIESIDEPNNEWIDPDGNIRRTRNTIDKVNDYYDRVESATEAYSLQQKAGIVDKIKEIEENKEDKRKISINFTWAVLIGLIIITVIIIFMIIVSILFLNFDDQKTISMLLDFLKFFISATVVEVLGLLYIITRYLFVDNFANSINSVNDILKSDTKRDD